MTVRGVIRRTHDSLAGGGARFFWEARKDRVTSKEGAGQPATSTFDLLNISYCRRSLSSPHGCVKATGYVRLPSSTTVRTASRPSRGATGPGYLSPRFPRTLRLRKRRTSVFGPVTLMRCLIR